MPSVSMPLQYKRLYRGPLDGDSVFNSMSDAIAYAKSPTAYAGQVIGVKNTDFSTWSIYIINDRGELSNNEYSDATVDQKGVVQLNDSINSDSVNMAATANAVNKVRQLVEDKMSLFIDVPCTKEQWVLGEEGLYSLEIENSSIKEVLKVVGEDSYTYSVASVRLSETVFKIYSDEPISGVVRAVC